MQNKGQVTYSIILGVVLLLIFIFVQTRQQATITPVNEEAISSKAQIESCLSGELAESVAFIALNGGYEIPLDPFESLIGNISTYYKDQTLTIPNLPQVESSIASVLVQRIGSCIKSGMQMQESPIVKVFISKETVNARVDMPITFAQGGASTSMNEFQSTFDARIPTYIFISQQLFDGKEGVPAKTIMDLMDQYNVTIDILHEGPMLTYLVKDKQDRYYDDVLNPVMWVSAGEQIIDYGTSINRSEED